MANILIVKCYVIMSHLNSLTIFLWELNPFEPIHVWLGLFTFGWDFIESDNFEGQRSNVLIYPSDYLRAGLYDQRFYWSN